MQKFKQTYHKYQNVFHNLSYMTVLGVFMLVLPLISYPYLIRVVGSENFGLVAYSLSIIAFFRIFVNFGFDMSAVKNIAQNSEDRDKLSIIVSSILVIQFGLYIVGFLVLYMLIELFVSFQENSKLLYYAYLLPLCDMLFVVWFFQGIEKMKYITIINVIVGLIGLGMIFIFIQESEDYIYIPLVQGISLLIGAIYSLYVLYKVESIYFVIPSRENLTFYFKESFYFFISRLSAVSNTETNTILLANYVSMSAVAYYDLAKKIIEVFKMPNSIINRVFYPYIAKTKNKILAKKIYYTGIIIAVILILIINLLAEYIVLFLGGKDMVDTLNIIPLFSIMLLLTAISYYIGATLLVSFNYANKFNLSVVYSTLLYLGLAFLLWITNKISINSIIYIMLLVESYIVIYRLYFCRKYKIL